MTRTLATLVLSAFLMSCSGTNPFTPDPEPGDPPVDDPDAPELTENNVPVTIAGDLGKVTYNPATMTLTVESLNLDELPLNATYRRRPGMDTSGYLAYTAQDDPLDRHVTAYVKEDSNQAAVRAAVAVSGGPRNRFFGGAYYERDGFYTPPPVTATTGLVSYAGSYVGVTNLDGAGFDLAAIPPGTPPELIPSQGERVVGTVFLNADFADNSVEGNIYDRMLVDSGTALPSIVLVVTDISGEGDFVGTQVEYQQGDPLLPGEDVIGTDIGDYGGIFGGTNAAGVAGGVHLTEFDGPGDLVLGAENEEEFGIFVLDQCGQPVDAAICDDVN